MLLDVSVAYICKQLNLKSGGTVGCVCNGGDSKGIQRVNQIIFWYFYGGCGNNGGVCEINGSSGGRFIFLLGQ